MQPPQGFDPQNGYAGGQDQGGTPPWNQLPPGQQWVRRPIPGQNASAGPAPGQVPPPAQIVLEQSPQGYANPPGPGAPMAGQRQMEQSGAPAASPTAPPPQNGYQPPKTGLPRTSPRRGKGIYIALALAVLGLAAFLAARMLSPVGVSYAQVHYGSKTAMYTGDAVLVRSETVQSQENVSQIDFKAEEGATVERGKLVATIYTSGFNAKEWVTLNNYRSQVKEYHKILIENSSSDSDLQGRMDTVHDVAMEVQRLVHGSRGSVNSLENSLLEAMQSQQIYIKQKNPDDQKLNRLYDDENTQLQRISTWTKQFAASADGLVSFYTDGYEKALNMSTYADFSPTEVRAMYNGQTPQVETSVGTRNATDIYRMVKKEQWAVLMLCHEKTNAPLENHTYNLVIESYDGNPLAATVVNCTRSGGELLVRLVVDDVSFLEKIMYLRSCQVRLSENVSSLTVPSNAIYVKNGRKGVVVVMEGGEYWTGVEVTGEDHNVAYVVPDYPGVLYDGAYVRLF